MYLKCLNCRNAVSRTLLYRATVENIVLLVKNAPINDETFVSRTGKETSIQVKN